MKKNLKDILREEIALEGLDGITFQALWIRLAETTSSKSPYPDSFKQYCWKLINILPCYQYFILPEARKDLISFNRFKTTFVPDDIYPHETINDIANNVKGSCSTYYTRVNVTEEAKNMNFEEIFNKWGSKFVIVADQKTREEFLFDRKGELSSMSEIKYCMLERIGRSRYNGEISHGSNSLLALGEDPKSLFYYRKSLLELNIIRKQIFTQKAENYVYNGTLLHLTRFYKVDKPMFTKLTDMVVNLLKSKEDYRMRYHEVKSLMKLGHFRKLLKSEIFIEHINASVFVPYRTIYPNVPPEEYLRKDKETEKQIRIMELKNPEAVVKFSNNRQSSSKKFNSQSMHPTVIKTTLNQSYLTQVCHAVKSFGGKGCSESEVKKKLGLPRLLVRILMRNAVRRKMIATFLIDDGRQRLNRYCYKEFENTGEMAQLVNKQRKATLELLLDNSDDDNDSDGSEKESETVK